MTVAAVLDRLAPKQRRSAILKPLLGGLSLCLALQSVAAPCRAHGQGADAALEGIPLPAARIVSLAPNITETLEAIGAADLVVGYSIFCKMQVKFPPRPVAGSFNQPDLKAIQSLKPDVVLFSEHAKPEDLGQLRAGGFHYLVLPANSIADIVKNIRLLGTLTGRTAKANDVAAGIERIVGEARARAKSLDPGKRPRVFLEVDGPDPLYTAGGGSFISEIVSLAGGVNVFADRAEAYPLITLDDVVKVDPEYIFVGGFNKSADEVRSRPGWDRISAVKAGKVRTGIWDLWLLLWRPGPSVGVTIQKLSKELGTADPASQN